MFTLLRIVSSTTVSELYFYVLISFSYGYSATLAAKLIIKLDLTWLDLTCDYFTSAFFASSVDSIIISRMYFWLSIKLAQVHSEMIE